MAASIENTALIDINNPTTHGAPVMLQAGDYYAFRRRAAEATRQAFGYQANRIVYPFSCLTPSTNDSDNILEFAGLIGCATIHHNQSFIVIFTAGGQLPICKDYLGEAVTLSTYDLHVMYEEGDVNIPGLHADQADILMRAVNTSLNYLEKCCEDSGVFRAGTSQAYRVKARAIAYSSHGQPVWFSKPIDASNIRPVLKLARNYIGAKQIQPIYSTDGGDGANNDDDPYSYMEGSGAINADGQELIPYSAVVVEFKPLKVDITSETGVLANVPLRYVLTELVAGRRGMDNLVQQAIRTTEWVTPWVDASFYNQYQSAILALSNSRQRSNVLRGPVTGQGDRLISDNLPEANDTIIYLVAKRSKRITEVFAAETPNTRFRNPYLTTNGQPDLAYIWSGGETHALIPARTLNQLFNNDDDAWDIYKHANTTGLRAFETFTSNANVGTGASFIQEMQILQGQLSNLLLNIREWCASGSNDLIRAGNLNDIRARIAACSRVAASLATLPRRIQLRIALLDPAVWEERNYTPLTGTAEAQAFLHRHMLRASSRNPSNSRALLFNPSWHFILKNAPGAIVANTSDGIQTTDLVDIYRRGPTNYKQVVRVFDRAISSPAACSRVLINVVCLETLREIRRRFTYPFVELTASRPENYMAFLRSALSRFATQLTGLIRRN